ncbi:MAG: hypothetical protein CSB24_06270 [Deltaproteobacteria bacterium]|nr:MAG: hypothetical protein CSB24_06270 [Deltaproteobacteria bacterium]
MDVFVARQPIFTVKKEIYAYELLFRTGLSNAFPDIDGNTATTSLLSSSFFTVGIEKISGGKLSFINFTEKLLLKKYPEMFPKDKIMIEVLENVNPTDEIVNACREMKENGYLLALDDFVYEESFTELIKLADLIKIDFMLTPRDKVEQMVAALSRYNCQLLAEKIETYEEFEAAVKMGFVYFQGYFFAKPEILQNRDISPNHLAAAKLLEEVNREEFDTDQIEKLVSQDVSISYKLLNYLNSAFFNRLQPVSSIRQAIAFLGAKNLRKFISLVVIGQLSADKPGELIRSSIIRARFLEMMGETGGLDGSELFMLGLLSQIDAMLDSPMENLVKKMPLSADIETALVSRQGRLAPFLVLVEAYETGNWQQFDQILAQKNIDDCRVVDCYVEAVGWADNF